DFHKAEGRADIYSLGCTFYFLLAGQPPFAGASLAQKLIRHQQSEPPPLEQFRSDVPREVVSVLRKMLAKRPEDRYQTAAEVAAALASVLNEEKGGASIRLQPSPRAWAPGLCKIARGCTCLLLRGPRWPQVVGVIILSALVLVCGLLMMR